MNTAKVAKGKKKKAGTPAPGKTTLLNLLQAAGAVDLVGRQVILDLHMIHFSKVVPAAQMKLPQRRCWTLKGFWQRTVSLCSLSLLCAYAWGLPDSTSSDCCSGKYDVWLWRRSHTLQGVC